MFLQEIWPSSDQARSPLPGLFLFEHRSLPFFCSLSPLFLACDRFVSPSRSSCICGLSCPNFVAVSPAPVRSLSSPFCLLRASFCSPFVDEMAEKSEQWRQRAIAMEEVKKHNSEKDIWCIIHGVVYDLTPLLHKHPGGVDVLLDFAGQDATEAFEDIGHSFSARQMAAPFAIGVLEGCEKSATGCMNKTLPRKNCCTSATATKGADSVKGSVGAAALVVLAAAAAVFYILNLS
ncbi:cytochrome b5 family heme/steroid binding domain-containing protein [Toxoplasma gondii ME49]|uniref:Cytochrome b5 family heme/steroid binding domain-containing protein n=1 Tax=Toxoplasma gondii (strain ATCC 50611 / Me49) TaxID=508771 RepID=S8F7T0_TOXGM|nr:cytochrome b5 family heme/steroid binding domain-containing protein [Toxoplasma gondii ME49]EPT31926.1 cytochrome b5 family heme/steroid binding domain-containing protein [Toxoplasma gondii ME49]|eukprot:XP_002371617.1 cytochrome b5 family heme/steroid binding domain-containing protein [Toxoplasma gondii ME49]